MLYCSWFDTYPQSGLVTNNTLIYIYIYIYIERERERERELNATQPSRTLKQSPADQII